MEPTVAQQARTAVATARVATLSTYGRAPCGAAARTTVVNVIGLDNGSVDFFLRPGSPAVDDLCQRRLATLQVAGTGCLPVVLAGACTRLTGFDADGRLRFRVDPLSVRLTGAARPVPVSDYRSARPDPLAPSSAALVHHLATAHADALLACVRSQLHPWAAFVLPVSLDRFGLRLTVVDEDGVTDTRLCFPAPVGSLSELPPSLRVLLACPSGCAS